MTVKESNLIDSTILGEIVGSLEREAPVSLSNILPVYTAFINESVEYEVNFADPLALALQNNPDASELVPSGLKIKIISLNMPFVSIEIKTDEEVDVGFGKVTLKVDGTEAELITG